MTDRVFVRASAPVGLVLWEGAQMTDRVFVRASAPVGLVLRGVCI